jgi:hypothetical protein
MQIENIERCKGGGNFFFSFGLDERSGERFEDKQWIVELLAKEKMGYRKSRDICVVYVKILGKTDEANLNL